MTVIAIPLEIFRLLSAQITEFYTQNAVHAVPSVETNPSTCKIRSLVDFDEKFFVTSFLLEIFRRLIAQITAPYALNLVHAVSNVETSLESRETRSFYDLVEKLSVISFPL
jgi:hypothetical protein